MSPIEFRFLWLCSSLFCLHPICLTRCYPEFKTSLVAQLVKKLPAMQESWVWSLGREDPLEKEISTYFSTLAWDIPWTEQSGRLSIGSQESDTTLWLNHHHHHPEFNSTFIFTTSKWILLLSHMVSMYLSFLKCLNFFFCSAVFFYSIFFLLG